ncbi:MAG: hypothetical protein U0T81_04630 [Saprospiraceae bacterium]
MTYPVYDDAKTIYADLMKRLDAAIASISASDGFGSSDGYLLGIWADGPTLTASRCG